MKGGPTGERCADCYFSTVWGDPHHEDPLHCHRYPPSMPAPENDYKDTPMPPTVGEDTWCGEFKRKLIP